MPRDIGSILCVHPNAELYGSDRVFLQAVGAFKARWPDAAITVVLPSTGQLSAALRPIVDDVRIEQMVVLRRARLVTTLVSFLRLPFAVVRARRRVRAYDLVYVSTVVTLDYLLATRFARGAALIHVHELPTGWTRVFVTAVLRVSSGLLIFISSAVRNAFPALAGRRSVVVWNGTRDVAVTARPPSDALNVLLIGRFNAWKGQEVLIEAVARIDEERRRRLKVRLVGSAFAGQEHFTKAAANLIVACGLSGCIEIMGFDPDPQAHYAWADVVVVPSTRPEPFGLVAIEAMAAGRATIVADYGGLSEIVVGNETGLLVSPGDVDQLAAALTIYLDDPALSCSFGTAGLARFKAEFQEELFMNRLADLAEQTILACDR